MVRRAREVLRPGRTGAGRGIEDGRGHGWVGLPVGRSSSSGRFDGIDRGAGSLLLLLLLFADGGGGGVVLGEGGGGVVAFPVVLEGEDEGVGGFDLDLDAEFGFGVAAEGSAGGRDVGVVAADGDADVPVSDDEVVRGVESDPSEAWEEGLDPGVGGVGLGSVVVLAAVVEISADVSAWDFDHAREGDHDVGEVLADAAALGEGVVDGGIDLGAARDVVEGSVDGLIEFSEEDEGVFPAVDAPFLGELAEDGGDAAELAGGELVPELAVALDLVEGLPGGASVGVELGYDGWRIDLDEAFGLDEEAVVLARDVEVVDGVSEVVEVSFDVGSGGGGEPEAPAALVSEAAGHHAGLHLAFGDGGEVAVLGFVLDEVLHVGEFPFDATFARSGLGFAFQSASAASTGYWM